MKVNSADGVSIACQVAGSGKPSLVFVHGYCCDGSYWQAQVPYFAQRYEVVTIDLAGHGESGTDRKTWSKAAFGGDVVAVVKELHLDQVILIGHSMGGLVIVEAALQMPECVAGLVIVDTFSNVEQTTSREKTEAFIAALQSDFVSSMRQFVNGLFTPHSDPILAQKISADMSAPPPTVAIGILRDMYLEERALSLSFDKVKAPIRCIASDRRRVNIEAAKRHASSFEVVYMSNVGHFVMMEDPETFNGFLDEIVKKLSSH